MSDAPGNDPRTDLELVAALNRGEDRAFDALYFRYRDWVTRLAMRFTRSADDSLDVMQETFLYVFGKFPGFTLSARMTTFLYPVVRNLSIAARRKKRGMQTLELLTEPTGAAGVEDDPLADLRVVMARLPETHREVMLMRFVDDMTVPEIALAMGIPEGTVKSRLHHAIANLRDDPAARRYFET